MTQRDHTVAVVGANGFIGTALTRTLRSNGLHVCPVTRQSPALERGELNPALREVSTVYWAASTINPQVAAQRSDLITQDITTFTEVLDRIHDEMPSTRVVLLSSGGTVYGPQAPPFAESFAPSPTSAYGTAKLEMERALGAHDLNSVVARISNAYGPGQEPAPGQGVIGHWLRALREGAPVTVYGGLGTVRDFVYVEDVTHLLLRLHGAPEPPPVVNVGSGDPTSLAAVVDAIHDVVGTRHLEIDFEPARPFDIPAAWLDVSLAARQLGWRATTPLRDGIAAMWDWLQVT